MYKFFKCPCCDSFIPAGHFDESDPECPLCGATATLGFFEVTRGHYGMCERDMFIEALITRLAEDRLDTGSD